MRQARLLAGYGSALLAVAVVLVAVVPIAVRPGDRYLVSTVWLPATLAAALVATGGIFAFTAARRQRRQVAAGAVLRQVRLLVLAGVAVAIVALLLAGRAAAEQAAGGAETMVTLAGCVVIGTALAILVGRVRS